MILGGTLCIQLRDVIGEIAPSTAGAGDCCAGAVINVGYVIRQRVKRLKRPVMACAVKRRRFPVGANPTRQPLQPEATGAAMEVTKWLKPSDGVSRNTVTARVCRP